MDYVRTQLAEMSTFETILAGIILVFALYMIYDIIRLVFEPRVPPPPVRVPPKPRDWNTAELLKYTGINGTPIYLSLKGKVYDVSSKPNFYGPGGPYGVFAGHDSSRCLATMSTSPEDLDKPLGDLNADQLETLDGWADKFELNYPFLGTLVDSPYFQGEKDK
eukprot:TRINITY_DN3605_c0_g4_i3.p1 TRINITY_DN3605_c0_g4~~TRINITY_DN3605_c0_g4_i3.p1  ORF type:complete len:163 (-),score=29.03 TRINITY_DN3605_c0_g4_i3:258-746(-)